MDLNEALTRLSLEQAPSDLGRRREATLLSLSSSGRSVATESYALSVVLAAGALVMGVVGGLLPSAGKHASDYASLSGTDHLAPSALLGGV